MIEQVFTVWTPAAVLVAIGGGIGTGLVAAFAVVGPKALLGLSWYIRHTLTMVTVITFIFWLGQIALALQEEDPFWYRIVGRFMLQELFAVCVGIGVWGGIRSRMRLRVWVQSRAQKGD